MSIRIMSRCWDHTMVKGTHLLLLLALGDFSNDSGVCWPGIPKLAQRMRVTERQVQRAINNLERDGELFAKTMTGGRGNYNLYLVVAGRPEKDITRALIEFFDMSQLEALTITDELFSRQREARYGGHSGERNDDVHVTVSPSSEPPETVTPMSPFPAQSEPEFDEKKDETVTYRARNGDTAMSPYPLEPINRQDIPTNGNDGSGSRARGREADRSRILPAPPPGCIPLPNQVISQIVQALYLRVPRKLWDDVIRSMTIERLPDGDLVVLAPSVAKAEWLAIRLDSLVRSVIESDLDISSDLTIFYSVKQEQNRIEGLA